MHRGARSLSAATESDDEQQALRPAQSPPAGASSLRRVVVRTGIVVALSFGLAGAIVAAGPAPALHAPWQRELRCLLENTDVMTSAAQKSELGGTPALRRSACPMSPGPECDGSSSPLAAAPWVKLSPELIDTRSFGLNGRCVVMPGDEYLAEQSQRWNATHEGVLHAVVPWKRRAGQALKPSAFASEGAFIDAHDSAVRINRSPGRVSRPDLHDLVGAKTTLRTTDDRHWLANGTETSPSGVPPRPLAAPPSAQEVQDSGAVALAAAVDYAECTTSATAAAYLHGARDAPALTAVSVIPTRLQDELQAYIFEQLPKLCESLSPKQLAQLQESRFYAYLDHVDPRRGEPLCSWAVRQRPQRPIGATWGLGTIALAMQLCDSVTLVGFAPWLMRAPHSDLVHYFEDRLVYPPVEDVTLATVDAYRQTWLEHVFLAAWFKELRD